MTKTTKQNVEAAESAIEQISSNMRSRVEEAIADEPIKSIVIAVVVGLVLGKFVL